MEKIINYLFPKYSKWELLEVFQFDCSYYTVQVRQNLNTGYKQFKCTKVIKWAYSRELSRMTVDAINETLTHPSVIK